LLAFWPLQTASISTQAHTFIYGVITLHTVKVTQMVIKERKGKERKVKGFNVHFKN